MHDLILPTDMIDAMRDAARDATIASARAFGFGGSTWVVERPSGSGTAARLPVRLPGTVQALAFRQRPSVLVGPGGKSPTGGAIGVADEVWRVIVLDDGDLQDVQVDDTLISTDPSGEYRVRIDSIERWYDYRRCEVSEVRHE